MPFASWLKGGGGGGGVGVKALTNMSLMPLNPVLSTSIPVGMMFAIVETIGMLSMVDHTSEKNEPSGPEPAGWLDAVDDGGSIVLSTY